MKKLLTATTLILSFLFLLTACANTPETHEEPSSSQTSTPQPSSDSAEIAGESSLTEPVILGVAHPQAIDHPQGKFVERVKARVEEASNGMIQINHYPSDQLGSADEVFRQTVEGSNAIYIGDFNQASQYVEELSVFNLPYMFNDPDHMVKVLTSSTAQELYNKLEETAGLTFLMPIYFGNRVMSTKGIQATTPEELNGVRIRCPQGTVSVDSVASLGCTPVPLALSELYMALQTGTVSGQENPLQTFVTKKFYEVQDTIILTNHTIGFSTILINSDIWNSIPEEYQELIQQIMSEEAEVLKQEILDTTSELRAECEGYGVTFIEPDFDAFKAYSLSYSNEHYAQYADLIEAVGQIK